MSDFYLLDRALTLSMKMYQHLRPEAEGIDGWQSVEDAEESRATVNLHLREKTKLGFFCKVYISLAEVDLERKSLSVEIMGMLEGHEFSDRQFTSIPSDYVMKEYHSLRPIVIESLLHRLGEQTEPKRIAVRKFEVKYRIHEGLYPQNADYMYEFDDEAISYLAIPYIKSMLDIHNRLYKDELN